MNVLINIGPGAGKEGKEEVKKATFPTLLTMIAANLSSGSIISGRSNGGSQVLWPCPSYLGTGRVGSLPTYRYESTSKIYMPKNIK